MIIFSSDMDLATAHKLGQLLRESPMSYASTVHAEEGAWFINVGCKSPIAGKITYDHMGRFMFSTHRDALNAIELAYHI